ncbi:MAG TPA: hypothetical protein VM617_08240, partial [Thermoanaerobaculia bacterium]|nr:hypothetical protein [Thermoanaerobaculia bacterium]
DATNLVANKLLIEAHLARGERERARQRLELYGLLNDGDPDIADLRRRIAGRDEAPPQRPVSPPADQAGDGDSTVDEVLAEGLSSGGEAAAESLAPEPTRSAQSTGARQSEAAAGTTTSAEAAAVSAQPFGDLAADGAERRYLQGLAEDGLFEVPGVATAPAEATEQAPSDSLSEQAAAAAPPPTPVATPDGEDDRPTVTLGQLYLDQGHFAQARRVFGALLDEEPGHPVALRGLERAESGLAEAGPGTLTAADLLQEAEPGQPARRAMLGAYLARILRPRESRAPDVPR